MRFQKTRAFSLVELITVSFIVSILVALLLPAVQSARESARRMSCSNRLRELTRGLILHESQFSLFPSNGGFDGDSKISSTEGVLVEISTLDRDLGIRFTWGIGNPKYSPELQSGSWAYSILPFIEQGKAFYENAITSRMELYLCPSRARNNSMPTINDRFGIYESGGWAWSKTDYAGNLLVIQNRPNCLRSSSIHDGLSHTIFLGEKSYCPQMQFSSSWYWDEPIFSGGSNGTARYSDRIVSDQQPLLFRENWGSSHTGGAQFAFGDGAVRYIGSQCDRALLDALQTPANGDVPPVDGSL